MKMKMVWTDGLAVTLNPMKGKLVRVYKKACKGLKKLARV